MLVHDDIAYKTRKIAVAEYITHRKGNIGGGGGGGGGGGLKGIVS